MNPFSVLDDSDDEAPPVKPKAAAVGGGGAKKSTSTSNNKKGKDTRTQGLISFLCLSFLLPLICTWLPCIV